MMSERNDDTVDSRREFLQSIGAGTVGMTGLASFTNNAQAAPSFEIKELNGSEGNKIRAQVLGSETFRILRKQVEKEFGAKTITADAQAYEVTTENKHAYALDVPLEGVQNGFKPAIAVTVRDGSIYSGNAVLPRTNDGRITQIDKIVAPTDKKEAVKSKSIPLATKEERKKALESSGEASDVSTDMSECGACKFIVSRICDYGCNLSGALFCGAIGAVNLGAGIACAVVYNAYCREFGCTGRYIKPQSDCEAMGYC